MSTPWVDLYNRLESLGYFRLHRTFGDGNLRMWDWDYATQKLTGDLQIVCRFGLCQATIPRTQLVGILGSPVVTALIKGNIARSTSRGITMKGTVLIGYRGRPTFIDLDPVPNGTFSEDVKAVMAGLPAFPQTGDFCSVFSNGGTECLPLGDDPRSGVTFVTPTVRPAVIKANWLINRSVAKIQFPTGTRQSSTQKFDLMLARIPCWMVPAEFSKYLSPDGGDDGLKQVSKVLAMAGDRLKPDGLLSFTALLYAHDTPAVEWGKLCEWADQAGLRLEARCTSRQGLEPGVPLFSQIMGCLQEQSKQPPQKVLQALLDYLCERRCSYVYFIRCVATRTRVPGKHDFLDLSDRYYGNWTI